MAAKRTRTSTRSMAPTRRSKKARQEIKIQPTTKAFFDLPRELRDKIYDEIWKPMRPFLFVYEGGVFAITYELPKDNFGYWQPELDIRKLPPAPGFYASKQMFEEAVDQFQWKASWKFLYNAKNYTLSPQLSRSQSCLTPWSARSVYFGTLKAREHFELQGNGSKSKSLVYFYDLSYLYQKSVIRSIHPTVSLRSLSFEICVYYRSEIQPCVKANRPIIIDFKPLTDVHIPSLRTLQIRISIIDGTMRDTTLDDNICQAVLRLGTGMVRGYVSETSFSLFPNQDHWGAGRAWTYIFKAA